MNGNAATSSAYEEGRVIWFPQDGPQTELCNCELPEIFFGGARGGGKTDGVLGKYAIKAGRYGAAFNALFIRRELPMLDDAIQRSQEIYGAIGAHYLKQAKTWIFPGGGRLRFRPMASVEDAAKYQGQNVTDACVEEAGLYPDPKPIDRLFGCLRSAHGVPVQLITTGNPGGCGQHWLKERYVTPAPLGREVLIRKLPDGTDHKYCFIPSRVIDNEILMERDPNYISRLHLVGSPELVRAWLEGDWSAIEGNYFPEFGHQHIVAPHEIPQHWTRIGGFDWGSASPFAMLWGAVSDGTDERYPKNALVIYREYYGASSPNVGLKMPNPQIGYEIAMREKGENVAYRKADTSIFNCNGGPSIAEQMRDDPQSGKVGVAFLPADNTRVAGWAQVRQRLVGDGERPALYIFSTCTNLIRTFPMMVHDENKPEDLDTQTDDHVLDALRYLCMGRPYLTTLKAAEPWKDVRNLQLRTFMDPTKVSKRGSRYNERGYT